MDKIQTLIGAVALALMLWIGNSVQQSRENFVALNANLVQVQQEIKDFKTDWKAHQASVISTISEHERRLNKLEWRTK